MVRKAEAAFNAMSPEQQVKHRCEQQKSWVIGNMLLCHPEMTREHAEKVYAELDLPFAYIR